MIGPKPGGLGLDDNPWLNTWMHFFLYYIVTVHTLSLLNGLYPSSQRQKHLKILELAISAKKGGLNLQN